MLLLPCIAYWLLYLILRGKGLGWLRAVLTAAVFSGTFLLAVTELLSLPRLLSRGPVAICWLVLCLASFVYLTRMKRIKRPTAQIGLFPPVDRATKILLASAGILVLLVGITALVSPPNVWDAMEYHLPRTTMWMSNHSVHFYPTPDYSQLIFGPWAEFAMMQTELLSGSDRFVNMVEFLSCIFSLIGVSLIAQMLGATPRGQALATIICALIPEGLLEASGPMNTYVVAFWILATVVFLLSWNDDPSWLNVICVGLSAGLAVLTKGSAYVYLPLLVLACWFMGTRASRLRFLKHCMIFLTVIIAVNLPQYARCYEFTGSPLGLPFKDGGPRLHWMSDHITIPAAMANVLRNVSLHSVTPSAGINAHIEWGFRAAIHGLGIDPDDPREIWPGGNFHLSNFSFHEIHAGNPLHLLLIIVCLILIFAHKNKDVQRRTVFWYSLGIIGAFLFFCSILRWQTWASRHHLPLFVLAAALVALVIDRYFSTGMGTVCVTLLLLYALPFAMLNRTRSLIPWSRVNDVYHPRSVLYFSDQHERIASTYIAAAEEVVKSKCNRVAIDSYLEKPESTLVDSPRSLYVYPLFALLRANGRDRKIWYTGVHNLTARYADKAHDSEPCAVVCIDCTAVPEKWQEYRSVGQRAAVFDYVVVFSVAGVSPNSGLRVGGEK